ncbi:MAG TPA: hypothetical protein VFP72_24445 [Kineosporiaceae bacterium]|nr:hypothetical protein [Kineosporiaceae bacterium]
MFSHRGVTPPLSRIRGFVLHLLGRLDVDRDRTRPATFPVRMILAVAGLLGVVTDVSGPESGSTDGLSSWMFAAAAVGAAGVARVAHHAAGLEGIRLPTTSVGTGWGSWTRCTSTVPLSGTATGHPVSAVILQGSRSYSYPALR